MVGRRARAASLAGRLAAPAILATGLAVATGIEAFACTATMGPLTFTPTSGPAGTVVKTSATGLKPYPAKYNLYFGGTCMEFNGKLLKVITTNLSGGWTNVKVTIPKTAAPGTYAFCGIESYPNQGQTATAHNAFTVV